jgi:hypothetical protein
MENTEAEFAQVAELRRNLIDEIFNAFGLPRKAWLRGSLWPLACLPAQRFSQIAATFTEAAQFGGGGRPGVPSLSMPAKRRNIRLGSVADRFNHPGGG